MDLPDDQKVNAIHAAVLPTGRILLIAGSGNKEDMFNAGTFKSLVYDPATGRSRVVPTPDDMFCAGHTFLGNGNLLIAGGTQRYERLDGAVVNAAGGVTVKNEDPDAAPRTFPAGTEFRSPEGLVYRAGHAFTVQPANKVATRRGATVTASETIVFAEAVAPGPQYVAVGPKQYAVGGLTPAEGQNIYALGQAMTMEKQDYQGIEETYEFNPFTESYERVGDMFFKRWYPTLTAARGRQRHRGLRPRRHRRDPQRAERGLRPGDPALDRAQGPHPVLPDLPGAVPDRARGPAVLLRRERRVRLVGARPRPGHVEPQEQHLLADPRHA